MVGAFVAFILLGTGLLWLPISADGPGHVGLEDALFTSTSAATVTGLASIDISRFSRSSPRTGWGCANACSPRPRSAPSTWATYVD